MGAVADVGVTELDHDRVLTDASPMPKVRRGVHSAPSHERCIRIYDSVQRSLELPRAPARSCAVGSRKREKI